jgi:cytoskeletal protein CcmA (bactofilin family)
MPLEGTHVMGNITVEAGASLTAYAIMVEGNLQAEEAGQIEIHPDSYVGGNIQVEESGRCGLIQPALRGI